MWRYFAGGAAALMLALAGMFLFRGSAAPEVKTPPPPAAQAQAEELPAEAPRASDRTREQKRFDRIDKNRDETVTRDEFLLLRRRAFAKLDTDGDGKLSFEEAAVRTTSRFAGADKDKSGTLTRVEFATTAPKRKPAQPRCACPKAAGKAAPVAATEEEGEGEE